jgi:carboxyl-terminal processing protease
MKEELESGNLTQDTQTKKSKNNSKVLLILIALFFSGVFFFFGFSIGKNQQNAPVAFDLATIENKKSTDNEVDFALFWDVWDLVKEKYVDHDSLEAQDMINGAINGMLAATGDPYTVFLDQDKFAELNEELQGSFEGIGAEVGIKDEILTIVTPLADSPAEKAGLRAGDKVAEIEGQTTADMTIDDAVDKMRGPKGTELHLKIFREDDEGMMESHDITVVRDTIHLDSVRVDFLDNDIAHVKLMQFGEDTVKEFNKIIAQMKQKNTKGIILDMRNDPGGILGTAITLASKFLPANAVVVMEQDADGKQTKLYTEGTHPLVDMPVVVLINEGSASASEILAGALRDNREDIVIVGEQSFGKGSVQELIPMGDATAAKITVAKWLTPSGEQINEVGIAPDVEVEYTNEDYKNDKDPQLDKAIEIMLEKIGQ